MKRGELRWSSRDQGWEILIPSVAFKNANSSFFGSKPFRLILPDLGRLYELIEAWIERHRVRLIGEAAEGFARTLEGRAPYTRSGDLASAVAAATAKAKATEKAEKGPKKPTSYKGLMVLKGRNLLPRGLKFKIEGGLEAEAAEMIGLAGRLDEEGHA